MMDSNFAKAALSKFVGCDGDEIAAGNCASPSVWLFGIEHGTYKSKHEGHQGASEDDQYSISTQLQWPYNQKAFKLLAAVNGYRVDEYLRFAEEHQPFVKGRAGYFKGNLYPFAFHDVASWTKEAELATGMRDKAIYKRWCQEHRLPSIKEWVDEYRPRIFIGVGVGCRVDFSMAVFGRLVDFSEEVIVVNGRRKRFFYFTEDWRKLIVVPHFSGANGLNSNESLQKAGQLVASVMNSD